MNIFVGTKLLDLFHLGYNRQRCSFL